MNFKDQESKIALFIDYDNIAIGLRESGGQKFEIGRILERLLEKGHIIFKRAYADWYTFSDGKLQLHEAGIEMIDIPMRRNIGKNSGDIRLVVDALDLCYTKEHIDTFVIGSGDSDFSPLVSKLKENNKRVIGFGLRQSTSNLLANNCDEFIFYEDVVSISTVRPRLPSGLNTKQHESFTILIDTVSGLMRENKDVLWGSLIKDTIRRKRPSFTESQYGYSSFSQLLEDAARHGLIGLIKDPSSGGTPVVTGFGASATSGRDENTSLRQLRPSSSGPTSRSSLLMRQEQNKPEEEAGGHSQRRPSLAHSRTRLNLKRSSASSNKDTFSSYQRDAEEKQEKDSPKPSTTRTNTKSRRTVSRTSSQKKEQETQDTEKSQDKPSPPQRRRSITSTRPGVRGRRPQKSVTDPVDTESKDQKSSTQEKDSGKSTEKRPTRRSSTSKPVQRTSKSEKPIEDVQKDKPVAESKIEKSSTEEKKETPAKSKTIRPTKRVRKR
ncbi:NYN domain-containing protein [bacterium]|nr:NYN domain-containing protein [bacterium]